MRNGRLSYEQFRIEAELLQKRSHALASRQKVGDEKCVATWEWRHGNRQVRRHHSRATVNTVCDT